MEGFYASSELSGHLGSLDIYTSGKFCRIAETFSEISRSLILYYEKFHSLYNIVQTPGYFQFLELFRYRSVLNLWRIRFDRVRQTNEKVPNLRKSQGTLLNLLKIPCV